MNNFECPNMDAFTGTITWFGAHAPEIRELNPLSRQIGLVSEWPTWMHEPQTAAGAMAWAAFTGLLFPKDVSSLLRTEFDDFAFQVFLGGADGMREWISEEIESNAFVETNTRNQRRWAMVGVAPKLAVGAFAIENQFPPLSYSVEPVIQTKVSVLPLRPEYFPVIEHLRTGR